ncbi:hypothetical protein AYI70_g5549, partial [Smittium culicis]
MPPKSTTYQ